MCNPDNNLNLASFQPVPIDLLLRVHPTDASYIQAIYRAAWEQARRLHEPVNVGRLSNSSWN